MSVRLEQAANDSFKKFVEALQKELLSQGRTEQLSEEEIETLKPIYCSGFVNGFNANKGKVK